jgi:hypothetical protein
MDKSMRDYLFHPDGTKKTPAERMASVPSTDKQSQPAPFEYLKRADGTRKTQRERFADVANYNETKQQLAKARNTTQATSPYQSMIRELKRPSCNGTRAMSQQQRDARIKMYEEAEADWIAKQEYQAKEVARQERLANDDNVKKALGLINYIRHNPADYSEQELAQLPRLQALAEEGEMSIFGDEYLQIAGERDRRLQAKLAEREQAALAANNEISNLKTKMGEGKYELEQTDSQVGYPIAEQRAIGTVMLLKYFN